MSDAKDNESFLRKVVRFVANPTTDWADLSQRPEELRETDYAKTELKQMIERKRRNDFVRKREFDMLRKVRREGLTSEQLAALGGSSRLDDSDGRLQDAGAKADYDVKAKINAIERQMVGEGFGASTRRPTPGGFYEAATSPSPLNGIRGEQAARRTAPADLGEPTQAAAPAPAPTARALGESGRVPFAASPRAPTEPPPRPPAATAVAPAIMSAALPPLSSSSLDAGVDFGHPFAVEVSEVAHDPELDEAVIAFANADFEQCEQALASMTGAGGIRAQHAETWLVRFDLYRAIGEQNKFESLAVDYAQQFGWSAPQWFSMPRLVAETRSQPPAERPAAPSSRPRAEVQVGWACPVELDTDAVAQLHSQTLQMPLPWVFDWHALERIEPEACARLSELFRHWAGERLEMRWLGGDRLLGLLTELSPTGVRDVDPAVWQLRLDALRLANRADQFDEAAIDYCVTYEVSPPSWERPVCQVQLSGRTASTASPAMTMVGEASSSFGDSTTIDEDPAALQMCNVELAGQLVGDISDTLAKMDRQLGNAAVVNVSCARLIRVDFIAAGDLLNWVLQRRNENRIVSFSESHRLVALFFGAMGINEHAKIKVRSV